MNILIKFQFIALFLSYLFLIVLSSDLEIIKLSVPDECSENAQKTKKGIVL